MSECCVIFRVAVAYGGGMVAPMFVAFPAHFFKVFVLVFIYLPVYMNKNE